MADLIWRRGDISMDALGRTIEASCDVRTLANGRRGHNEVVFTTTRSGKQGVPYDPTYFPVGLWIMTSVEDVDSTTDPKGYLGPKIIRTDAYQRVERWEVAQEESLVYVRPSGAWVFDYGYLIHWSNSPTTLGCIKVHSLDEHLRICEHAAEALREGRDMTLEVVA